MLIRLIRNQPQKDVLTGRLYLDSVIDSDENIHRYELCMDTLEHMQYAIPTGFYRLRLTYSPRFQEILPLLDGVYGPTPAPSLKGREVNNGGTHRPIVLRTGIRIHAGNTIEHTTGCILVGDKDPLKARLLSSRQRLEEMRAYLLNYQKRNPNEEIYIEISETDPYPDADTPCNFQQQQHIYESLQRAKEMRVAFEDRNVII